MKLCALAVQVGSSAVLLDQSAARSGESNLGSYVCDAMVRYVNSNTSLEGAQVRPGSEAASVLAMSTRWLLTVLLADCRALSASA